jgi:hypothetical protein
MSDLGCGGCDEITLPIGEPGVDGKNAFTITTSSFTQPAVGSTVPINVSNLGQYTNSWASVGQIIYITDASGNGGWYSVVSKSGETSITINNLYATNTAAGLTISSGASVSPSGPPGINGTNGSPGVDGGTGSQGASGLNGVSILRTAQGTNTLLATYTDIATISPFAANELCTLNGDKAVLEATVYVASLDLAGGNIRVLLNGVSITPALIGVGITSEPTFKNSILVAGTLGGSGVLKVDIYRKSSVLASVTVSTSDVYGNNITYNSGDFTTDFASAITLLIQGKLGKVGANRQIGCNRLTVTSFKKQ